jgi:hypothetical protein
MNPLKWTSIDLAVDASPGPLASGINSELSLPLLTSIGLTYQDTSLLQSVMPYLYDISRVDYVS